MASRRDELNAYTFAKRRTLAAFIQPSPTGSEEGAPRPLRAVIPGAIVAVVLLAVFGAWGMFKPKAPTGWNKPNEKVIIASDSTTRYVILKTGDGEPQLHPVLNMASAKLLLTPGKGEVVTVDESVLDKGKIPHGATIGIPYAPDRLPSPSEAGAAKRWAVCERPGQGGRAIQKAAFVLAERDQNRTEGRERLRGGELLDVIAPDKTRYVVDAEGRAYDISAKGESSKDREVLQRIIAGKGNKPQRVSRDWIDTLSKKDPITFPDLGARPGTAAHAGLGPEIRQFDKVGMVLKADDGAKTQHYVVLPGRVAPVSDFTAYLLLNSSAGVPGQGSRAQPARAGSFTPDRDNKEFPANSTWPTSRPHVVNGQDPTSRTRSTVCNVLRDVDKDGKTVQSTWAGTDFPATLPAGSSSAYVTPGSGQLYRQFQGSDTGSGGLFLTTDTGLRYAMQSNGDSATDDAGIGTSVKERKRKQAEQEARQAQVRLGYGDTKLTFIPATWSKFLPTGPRLSTAAARQPQGS
ncbi:type VII secretion protein EccB [Actinomycetota bacterium Odt1-20B]